MLDNRKDPNVKPFYDLGFLVNDPNEELYDLKKDPYTVNNVADLAEYETIKKKLSKKLFQWMQDEKDLYLNGGGDEIDRWLTIWAWITEPCIECVKE